MNNITAFTKLSEPVLFHSEIENAVSDPVKIIAINPDGAWPEKALPQGSVIIYDLLEYDETETVRFTPIGHERTTEGYWVQAFDRETIVERTPRTETFAVVVDETSEFSQPVGAEPAPVIPLGSDDDGGSEITEFLGESKG